MYFYSQAMSVLNWLETVTLLSVVGPRGPLELIDPVSFLSGVGHHGPLELLELGHTQGTGFFDKKGHKTALCSGSNVICYM